jgi:hypothetical protein
VAPSTQQISQQPVSSDGLAMLLMQISTSWSIQGTRWIAHLSGKVWSGGVELEPEALLSNPSTPATLLKIHDMPVCCELHAGAHLAVVAWGAGVPGAGCTLPHHLGSPASHQQPGAAPGPDHHLVLHTGTKGRREWDSRPCGSNSQDVHYIRTVVRGAMQQRQHGGTGTQGWHAQHM